jgi:hypothetical protein
LRQARPLNVSMVPDPSRLEKAELPAGIVALRGNIQVPSIPASARAVTERQPRHEEDGGRRVKGSRCEGEETVFAPRIPTCAHVEREREASERERESERETLSRTHDCSRSLMANAHG